MFSSPCPHGGCKPNKGITDTVPVRKEFCRSIFDWEEIPEIADSAINLEMYGLEELCERTNIATAFAS